MKKIFSLILVAIAFSISCANGQNKSTLVSKQNVKYIVNGGKTPAPIGAVSIINGENSSIKILKVKIIFEADTINKNNFKEVYVEDNDGFWIENREENYPWFNLLFEHHYGSEFICVGITKNYYKILVNDQGQAYWVRRSPLLQFKTLDKYFKSFIGFESTTNQHMHLKPEVNAPLIPYSGDLRQQTFSVVQIQGDWMEIKSGLNDSIIDYHDSNDIVFKSGWIKWRSGNSLLIRIIDSM